MFRCLFVGEGSLDLEVNGGIVLRFKAETVVSSASWDIGRLGGERASGNTNGLGSPRSEEFSRVLVSFSSSLLVYVQSLLPQMLAKTPLGIGSGLVGVGIHVSLTNNQDSRLRKACR